MFMISVHIFYVPTKLNFTSFKLFLQVSFDGETINQNGFLHNMPLDGVCFHILNILALTTENSFISNCI